MERRALDQLIRAIAAGRQVVEKSKPASAKQRGLAVVDTGYESRTAAAYEEESAGHAGLEESGKLGEGSQVRDDDE